MFYGNGTINQAHAKRFQDAASQTPRAPVEHSCCRQREHTQLYSILVPSPAIISAVLCLLPVCVLSLYIFEIHCTIVHCKNKVMYCSTAYTKTIQYIKGTTCKVKTVNRAREVFQIRMSAPITKAMICAE